MSKCCPIKCETLGQMSRTANAHTEGKKKERGEGEGKGGKRRGKGKEGRRMVVKEERQGRRNWGVRGTENVENAEGAGITRRATEKMRCRDKHQRDHRGSNLWL